MEFPSYWKELPMPVSTIERPVSALRQRMLEDMAMRGLRSDTQHEYIRFVRAERT
jgi:integrase/recombinase XerD